MNDDIDKVVFKIKGCGKDRSVANDGQCTSNVYGITYNIANAR